jgi:hypothetical protein
LFFQPSPALLELLNLRLVTNVGFAALKELGDVAVWRQSATKKARKLTAA